MSLIFSRQLRRVACSLWKDPDERPCYVVLMYCRFANSMIPKGSIWLFWLAWTDGKAMRDSGAGGITAWQAQVEEASPACHFWVPIPAEGP